MDRFFKKVYRLPQAAGISRITDKTKDPIVLFNSIFLIGTTIVSSGFGFLFWMIAARSYSPEQVGIGVAYINIITLIAILGDMGLGIAIIRFAVSLGDMRQVFINTTTFVECGLSILLSLLFLASIPLWTKDLHGLSQSFSHLVLYISSVLAFLLAQFLDNLYIAFQKTNFLFIRNFIAGLLRVVFLLVLPAYLGPFNLLLAVGLGAGITLLSSYFYFLPKTVPEFHPSFKLSFGLLWEKASFTMSNHFTNLMWSLPPLLYPLIVFRVLGPEANAQFYICWMIANLLFIIPVSTATSSFAHLSSEPKPDLGHLWRYLIYTLLGLVLLVPVSIVLSPWIIGLFGSQYTHASILLIWLSISVLPYCVNIFGITFYRINAKISRLLMVSGVLTCLSILSVAIGGSIRQLPGIGFGWLLAQSVGALWVIYWLRRG